MNIRDGIFLIVGSGIGFGCCLLWLSDLIRDLRYDREVAEDELHRRDLEDKWNVVWESEADRLRRQHAGTPYIDGPGVRGGMYSAAYLDSEDAA